MIGLGIWIAGLVTGAAGGFALGFLLGRDLTLKRRQRAKPPPS
jgi:hypothetical protein